MKHVTNSRSGKFCVQLVESGQPQEALNGFEWARMDNSQPATIKTCASLNELLRRSLFELRLSFLGALAFPKRFLARSCRRDAARSALVYLSAMSSASEHWNRSHRTSPPHHCVIKQHPSVTTRIMVGARVLQDVSGEYCGEDSAGTTAGRSKTDSAGEAAAASTGKVTVLPIPSRYGRWIAGLGGHQTPKGNDSDGGWPLGRHVATATTSTDIFPYSRIFKNIHKGFRTNWYYNSVNPLGPGTTSIKNIRD